MCDCVFHKSEWSVRIPTMINTAERNCQSVDVYLGNVSVCVCAQLSSMESFLC